MTGYIQVWSRCETAKTETKETKKKKRLNNTFRVSSYSICYMLTAVYRLLTEVYRLLHLWHHSSATKTCHFLSGGARDALRNKSDSLRIWGSRAVRSFEELTPGIFGFLHRFLTPLEPMRMSLFLGSFPTVSRGIMFLRVHRRIRSSFSITGRAGLAVSPLGNSFLPLWASHLKKEW